MAKPSKKKSYTEDVVLNKILQDIADENLQDSDAPLHKDAAKKNYEDDLIRHYREQDALKSRQKYINIAKIVVVFLIMVFLILLLTSNHDTTVTEQTQVKKTVIPTPAPQHEAPVEKVPEPVETKPVKMEKKENIPVKEEPKVLTPAPEPAPVKRVKTEREIAKELLLQQMKN